MNPAGNPEVPGATFSPDRVYRYTLTRELYPRDQVILNRTVTFICLNPSTADEKLNDPTVRRAMNYAKSFGASKFIMLNIFGLRSTDPKELYRAEDPIGPDNDYWLKYVAGHSDYLVAAWGNHGRLHGRGEQVYEMLKESLWCLKVTGAGEPGHPLYLPASLKLSPYRRGGRGL